ncbi:CBS domain-containing protein [Mesorhizobium atlanticum]
MSQFDHRHWQLMRGSYAGKSSTENYLAASLSTQADITEVLMTTVQQILDAKGHDVYFVRPEDTVLHALQLMEAKNVGAVLIKDGDRLVGIFTERHYARNVFLRGRSVCRKTLVREVMEKHVVFCGTVPDS